MSRVCSRASLARGGSGGGVWLLSFSATAGGVLQRGRVCCGGGCGQVGVLRQGAPMSVRGWGPQLSSSGTGAAVGPLLFSSVSPAGRSRAGLGLECRCLRMKGKTLRAERGECRQGPVQRPGGLAPALTASWSLEG